MLRPDGRPSGSDERKDLFDDERVVDPPRSAVPRDPLSVEGFFGRLAASMDGDPASSQSDEVSSGEP